MKFPSIAVLNVLYFLIVSMDTRALLFDIPTPSSGYTTLVQISWGGHITAVLPPLPTRITKIVR